MGGSGTSQSIIGSRRIKNGCGKGALIFHREAYDLRFLNHPMRLGLGSGDNEITHTTTLQLSGTLHHKQGFRSNPRLDTGGTVGVRRHSRHVREITGQCKAD